MTLTRESLEAARKRIDELDRLFHRDGKWDRIGCDDTDFLVTTARAGIHTSARIAELEAENARLKDKLRPFAERAKHFKDFEDESLQLFHVPSWTYSGLTIRDFRDACQALKGTAT